MRKVLLLAALAMAATMVFAPAVLAQDPSAVNCDDFATQEEAQAFFEANNPANDPYLLDEDPGVDDVVACEDLPSGGPTPAPTNPDDDPTPTNEDPDDVQYGPDDTQYGPDDVQYETAPPTTTALPETGGVSALALAPLALLLGSGIVALRIVRRS